MTYTEAGLGTFYTRAMVRGEHLLDMADSPFMYNYVEDYQIFVCLSVINSRYADYPFDFLSGVSSQFFGYVLSLQ